MNTSHILLVDDDVMTAAVLKDYLEALKYTVSVADNVEEATVALSNPAKIDLVILDYIMPDANGTELLRTIARRTDMQRPPVILASSIIDPHSSDWKKLYSNLAPAAQSLIYGFVSKPFAFESLEVLLTDTLKIRAINSEPPQALSGDYFADPSSDPAPEAA